MEIYVASVNGKLRREWLTEADLMKQDVRRRRPALWTMSTCTLWLLAVPRWPRTTLLHDETLMPVRRGSHK